MSSSGAAAAAAATAEEAAAGGEHGPFPIEQLQVRSGSLSASLRPLDPLLPTRFLIFSSALGLMGS